MARQRLGLSPDSELERLYKEQSPRLWRALYAYAGDRDVASDAVAEAFAQLMGRGDAVRDARMWVWKTAFRVAGGELQHRRRFTDQLPERAGEPSDVRPEVAAALRVLTARQRAVVVLTYWGFSSTEAARVLGTSPPTIRVHLMVARSRLRQLLGDDDD